MNYIRAKTVKARLHGAWFDYFGNHSIKKDCKQRTLRWWMNEAKTTG